MLYILSDVTILHLTPYCLKRPLRDVARETFGISVKIVKKEQEDPALPMLYKTLRRTVAPLPLTSSCRSEARLVLDSARQLRQAGAFDR